MLYPALQQPLANPERRIGVGGLRVHFGRTSESAGTAERAGDGLDVLKMLPLVFRHRAPECRNAQPRMYELFHERCAAAMKPRDENVVE